MESFVLRTYKARVLYKTHMRALFVFQFEVTLISRSVPLTLLVTLLSLYRVAVSSEVWYSSASIRHGDEEAPCREG